MKPLILASLALAACAIAETPNLRGFGRVEVTGETLDCQKRQSGANDANGNNNPVNPDNPVEEIACLRFACETPEKAETVAGKFLLDLSAEPGVAFRDGIHETPGGTSFAVLRDGATTTIYAAASRAALGDFISRRGAEGAEGKLVGEAAVPEWMKAFGWGVYGMGGLEDYHGWIEKAKEMAGIDPGADKSLLDPRDDFAFLREMGPVHFDNWLEPDFSEFSDNIASSSIHWRRKLAESFGVPYGCRLYMPIGDRNGHSWFDRRFAAHHDQPPAWLPNSWDSYVSHKSHMSWFDEEIWGYTAARTKEMMERFGDNGRMRTWMIPSGETSCGPWYDWHSDYSQTAADSWHAYLRKRGVTLDEAAAMFNRADRPFASREEVPIPEFATFAGLPGLALDLYGEWLTTTNVAAFRPIAPGEREAPHEAVSWTTLPDFPGSWDFLALYAEKGKRLPKTIGDPRRPEQKERLRLFRRVFGWHASLPDTATGRIWLYFFPMSGDSLRHEVSLNGGKAHTVGNWCAIDVTDDLKEGENTLDILFQGSVWKGRVFLSTEEPQLYPNMAEARCRLWALWHDWRRDAKAARFEELFDAMRQADPNAPIEVMAPAALGMRTINRLCRDWGGYSHFTGEGMWFFPWWKRYAKLYGYQGTSETAGPNANVAAARTSALRVFLAGLDMHKPVFLAQSYSRNPELREWWLSHKDLFARMGTYDIDLAQPQVLVYRRFELIGDPFPEPFPMIGKAARKPRQPWNYDMGRGSLQSIGQSFLYIDGDGLEDGKMEGFKVMLDCGNEIIPEEEVARIGAWVERGGVFVAYPFTGRSTPLKADAWPMAALTGTRAERIMKRVEIAAAGGAALPTDSAKRRQYGDDVALEPVADGVEVLVRYADGRPAITAHRLGKGLVVHIGSFYWRGSEDVNGIWNPQDEAERAFLRALLAYCGQAPALVETDDRLVLAQPYRSHDGLDLVAVLCNFNEAKDGGSAPEPPAAGAPSPTTVRLRTGAKPRRIVAFAGTSVVAGAPSPAGGAQPAPFDWDEATGIATLRLALPPQEVAILNAECYAPGDALDYWWRNSAEQWHELKQPTRDFSKYSQGEWRDPTQDLKEGWRVAPLAQRNDERRMANDENWNAAAVGIPLDCLQFWGWPEGQGAVCRKAFDLDDPGWIADGGRTLLILRSRHPAFSLSPTTVRLNGETLVESSRATNHDLDVTRLIRPTGNALEVEFGDGGKFTGLDGSIYLYHRAAPIASVWVKGEELDARHETIDANGDKNTTVASDVPRLTPLGTLRATAVLRGKQDGGGDAIELFVPAGWEGKYRVRLYMEGTREMPWGVKVRDRYVRKRSRAGTIADLDITELLRFGETNRIDLGANAPGEHPDKTSEKALTTLRIDLY